MASGSSGQTVPQLLKERRGDNNRKDVRLGEIAVIVGIFLAARGARLARIRVEMARFLLDNSAAAQNFFLAVEFVGDGPGYRYKTVQVLDLGTDAELFGALRAERYVDVAPHGPLLHAAVRNTDGPQDRLQLLEIFRGLLGAAQFRLRDDLDERHAARL